MLMVEYAKYGTCAARFDAKKKAAFEAAAELRVKQAGAAVKVAAKVAIEAPAPAAAGAEQAAKGSMWAWDDDAGPHGNSGRGREQWHGGNGEAA